MSRSTTRSARAVRPAVAVLAALLLALVTACSSGASGGGTEDAGGGAGGTRSVESAFGPIEVPSDPQRVVALDGTVGAVLDSGRVPLGISFFDDKQEWFSPQEWAQVEPLPVVWTAAGPDIEAIAALEPDLVVRLTRVGGNNQISEEDRGYFERLRSVVPATVFLPSAGGEDVKNVALQVSEILGDGARATAERDRYTERTRAILEQYGPVLANQRLAPLGGNSEQAFVFGGLSWTGGILEDAGFPLADAAARAAPRNATFFSFEQFSTVGDATAVLYEVDQAGQPTRTSERLLASPTYAALPAVQAGRAYPIRFYYADRYATANVVLDQLEAEVLPGLR